MLRATIVLLLLLLPTLAHADKRVALVIGNSAYEHTGKLANPKNDASDMAAVLKKLGFQVIEGLRSQQGGVRTEGARVRRCS